MAGTESRRRLTIERRDWPARGEFRIARSRLSVIPTVQIAIRQGAHTGRAECRPYARYDQTVESVTAAIEAVRDAIETGTDRAAIQSLLPPGPARNAVDCALWDLEAKRSGRRVSALAGLPAPRPRQTAFTLSVDTPDAMAKAALAAASHTLLKVKLSGDAIIDSLDAICSARPDAQLIVDANEAFDPESFEALYARLEPYPIILLEQPIPAGSDRELPRGRIPICADESLHTAEDLPRLAEAGYRAVNVKLDKCGGLTAGLALMRAARAMDMTVMAGCMVGSSLAMAPMMIAESLADVIDLDGPLLMKEDEPNGLRYDDGRVFPPAPELWG